MQKLLPSQLPPTPPGADPILIPLSVFFFFSFALLCYVELAYLLKFEVFLQHSVGIL